MDQEIIIGYDPEHRGDDVLKLGRVFADVLGARPLVVTAKPWPNQLDDVKTQQQRVESSLEEAFAAARTELLDFGVETKAVVSAYTGLTLNDLAEEHEAVRLIVLGSSHHGTIGRTLIGDVGESLMHGAPCAVAVAPRGYGSRRRHALQRIAVAFDGSEESHTALSTAIGLAARCHAEITVVAVADYPRYGYGSTYTVLTAGEVSDPGREETRRQLELAAARIPSGILHQSRLLIGKAGRELADVSGDFDLIIAGSRAYGPLRRTLLGSTTRKLMRAAACPVLILPRGAGPDPLCVDIDAGRVTAGADSHG